MKKLLCLLLATIMMFSLAACGGDADTAPAEETTQYLDMKSISGYWKYDDYDYYFAIYAENVWTMYDMDGNQTDNGDYTFDGSTITPVSANGMDVLPMTIVDANQLADTDGDTLSRYDPSAVEVADGLPHANDPLTQSVALYEADGVYVSYPDTIKVVKVIPENRFVNLDAVSENDVHHTILANYIEMGTGYDKHFDCGADSARYVLLQMADIVMNDLWDSDKIVGYTKFEFTDNGDYFGLRVWGVMSGTSLVNCDLTQVPMVLEIRYVGPVGYLPVMMCIAENERIDDYYNLMHNMFDSMTYPYGWSTTPTRQPAASDYNPYSDPGDGDYWYDDYYYVDDDGVNPYDSDAGGYWSDPGETGDNMYWDGDMWLEGQNADW